MERGFRNKAICFAWTALLCVSSLFRISAQPVLPDNMMEADCATDVQQQPWDAHVLRSYDIHGNLLAISDVNTPCEGVVSVTDFNGDGWPEVYIGNVIYDAATLKRLCAGPPDGNMGRSWRNDVSEVGRCAMPFAANVLGDSIPELICGNTIYRVSIASRTDMTQNSVTELKTVGIPSWIPQDGNVAVVDFNMDGQLDVLVVIDQTGSNIYPNFHP